MSQEAAERDVLMWKEEKEEQREETPLKLLTLLHDLLPPRCESHMFGEGGASITHPAGSESLHQIFV